MRLFIVIGEHPQQMPVHITAHASAAGAAARAAELVRMIARDTETDGADGVTADNWTEMHDRLQDEQGAAHCGVEIIATDLRQD